GRRPGAPKAFGTIAGTTMLPLAARAAAAAAEVVSIVAVVPQGWERRAESLLPSRMPLVVVAGGPSRQESVRRGLDAAPADAAVIVCHDAARPFASPRLFSAVCAALVDAAGCVPVVRVPDPV